ncbi:hypothetical protein [Nitrospirillum amazonense]|uniref:hypothetical protein n=1 Tax=Nitrospirillum amazonense TaxID=28077 RepID=UPI002412B586|nr:hypothetical protein [Nitrospirillum amazonense]MDG3442632.1 hypothetical protein [Nitrospirillum amazonense]
MRSVTGRLSLPGNGIVAGKFSKYSVVKIGDIVLNNIHIAESLDSFLNVHTQGDTTIYWNGNWLSGRQIRAIRTPSGDLYYLKRSILFVTFFVVFSILTIPILGFGLLLLPALLADFNYCLAATEFKAQGGIPIPL